MFCERQCALIHLEQAWRENRLTAEGRILHTRVDDGVAETRGGLRIARGLAIRSLRLGLSGRADAVELHRVDEREAGVLFDRLPGRWRPFPVEYKRGVPKWVDCDRVQLCAQALCLEEMLGISIDAGALFYGSVRRREEVDFDERLRNQTESAARRFHELMRVGLTPIAFRAPKCRSCSLLEICLPGSPRRPQKVARYLASALAERCE